MDTSSGGLYHDIEDDRSRTPPQSFNTISTTSSLAKRLDRYFEITARGSTISTELRAGIILYASMCYIIVVNPDILSAAGLEKGHTATATTFSGMVCTLLFSLYANLPFGSAPGMGLNTLFAYELVRQNDLTPEQALGCSLAAGLVFLFLALTGLSSVIVNNIPLTMKKAVVVGIGFFQTIIGLYSMGIIAHGRFTILEMGDLSSASQWMAIFTLVMIALLLLLEVPGSILVGIIVSMALSLMLKLSPVPKEIFSLPQFGSTRFDFSILKTQTGALMTLFLFLVLFIDTGGVMIGLAAQGESLLDRHGNVVNASKGYVSLGIGVLVSSYFGTSPMVIFLESAAAINQGGRTGLTSLVSAALLGLSAFFVPLIRYVPTSATSPILVLVGSFMMGAVMAIPWDKINHSLPAYITIAMITFTCSISHGLLAGLLFYFVLNVPFVIARVSHQDHMTILLWLEISIVVHHPSRFSLQDGDGL
ncbi:guanine/hypoxanthine permease PbuO-like [Condylostylus longicornis]|uniref:guanine/hypoxanthine permease PbuO-like n=1 Tax=Condylostylus longicornis TaxID=2530218 RepID=UPI00244DC330|nr:guanine/hypoxanthine permease PbuO-like [Condylostylus longicornis]